MHWIRLIAATVLSVPGVAAAAAVVEEHAVSDALTGKCPITGLDQLVKKLSKDAQVFFPGSAEFVLATTRWSSLDLPNISIVVVPDTENDVAETVCAALCFSYRH
jgi:hypothetical protein